MLTNTLYHLKIDWNNRLSERLLIPYNVHSSVDGTDCMIQEPTPFDPKWYSHKFKGPGLRYEIGLSILTGSLIWVNGPYESGSYPDLKIFKRKMAKCVKRDEFVVGDNGYNHAKCLIPDNTDHKFMPIHSRIRARHETVNRRFKQFNVLHHKFRHGVNKHAVCFHAVSQLTALSLQSGNSLFQI